MKQALVVDDHPIVREGVTDLLQRALDLIDAVKMALRGGPAKKTRQAIVPVLSDREIQVLTHFAKGMSRKDISKQLRINERTVSTYKTRLLHKLDLRNLVDLIRYATEEGLIE